MRIFSLIGLTFILSAASVVLAQTGDPITVAPLTNIGLSAETPADIGGFINTLYTYGIGVGAIAAVLVIIYGGFKYMTSQAPGGKGDGRDAITRAILGLLLLLSPFIVFSVINSDITRFNLDFSFGGALNDGTTQLGTGGGTRGECEAIAWNESGRHSNILAPDRDRSSHLPSVDQMSANQLRSCCTYANGVVRPRNRSFEGRSYVQNSCDYREVGTAGKVDIHFTDETFIQAVGFNISGDVRVGLCEEIDSRLRSPWANTQVNTLFENGVLAFGPRTRNTVGDKFDDIERLELSSNFFNPNDFVCGGPFIVN